MTSYCGRPDRHDASLEKFRARLDISRRGLTYAIAISFTSNRPGSGGLLRQRHRRGVRRRRAASAPRRPDEAADWLQNRLKTLNDRLRTSEDAVAAFRLEHKIVNAGKESTTQQLRVDRSTRARSRAARARNSRKPSRTL